MNKKASIFSRFWQILVPLVNKGRSCAVVLWTSICHYKEIAIKIFLPLLIILCGYYACSVSKNNIKQSLDEIFDISDEIRSYYADKPGYWGLSTAKIIEENILSPKYIKDQKIVLSHGYNILVGSGESGDAVMPLSYSFDIVLQNLNKAQCISFAEAPLNDENNLKLDKITIVNPRGTYSFEWGAENPLPIKKYATKNMCLDGKNTLIWSVK